MLATIKEYWAQITVLVLVVGIVSGAYMEFRITKIVATEIKAVLIEKGLVDPAAVKANTESIDDLEDDQDKLHDKIERIVDILLEP